MSKLIELREWVTLDEGAAYLSAALDESVSVPALLQLALEDKLRISVHLPHAYGRVGEAVPPEQATIAPPIVPRPHSDPRIQANREEFAAAINARRRYVGITISKTEIIELSDVVYDVSGVWDLPMHFGAARSIVAAEHRERAGLPEIDLIPLWPIYVIRDEHFWCSLVTHVAPGTRHQEPHEDDMPSDEEEADVIAARDANEKEYLMFAQMSDETGGVNDLESLPPTPRTTVESWQHKSRYTPLFNLPDGAAYCLRPKALRALVASVKELKSAPDADSSKLDPRERSTLLAIIATLLQIHEYPTSHYEAADKILKRAPKWINITTETYAKKIKEAIEKHGPSVPDGS